MAREGAAGHPSTSWRSLRNRRSRVASAALRAASDLAGRIGRLSLCRLLCGDARIETVLVEDVSHGRLIRLIDCVIGRAVEFVGRVLVVPELHLLLACHALIVEFLH